MNSAKKIAESKLVYVFYNYICEFLELEHIPDIPLPYRPSNGAPVETVAPVASQPIAYGNPTQATVYQGPTTAPLTQSGYPVLYNPGVNSAGAVGGNGPPNMMVDGLGAPIQQAQPAHTDGNIVYVPTGNNGQFNGELMIIYWLFLFHNG